jgi:hypothetical protein
MGHVMIKGVCQRRGSTYRRFRVKLPDGRWGDQYVKLPDPSHPNFAAELARVNGEVLPRQKPATGTMAALIAEFRPSLAKKAIAASTRSAWAYYLDLIEQQHGHRIVRELERKHCYALRDGMADEPGKANNYMAKFKALLEFGAERGWISVNPAAGIPLLETGEHEPWPAYVIRDVLEEADAMLRLAVITGLCSGQRISDAILMQHGWHDGRIMRLRSKKTDTGAVIPMHPLWVAEIGSVPRKSVTLLYDRSGKPFRDTDRLQARLRRLMRKLGHVDGHGQARYTYHGLSKNACCYLTELDLSDETIGAIVGKTPETVRHYAKEARRWMLAERAAAAVIAGHINGLVGKTARIVGKVSNGD